MKPKDKKIVRDAVAKELSKRPLTAKKDIEPATLRITKDLKKRRPSFWKHTGWYLINVAIVSLLMNVYIRLVQARLRRARRKKSKKFIPFRGRGRSLGKNNDNGVPPNIGGQNVMAFTAMKRQGLTPTTIRRILSERRTTIRPPPTMRPRTLSDKKRVAGMSNLPRTYLDRFLHHNPDKPNNF